MSWAVVLVVVALLFLFVAPVLALLFYSPERALAVRHAEAIDETTVVRQADYLRMRHPEIVKTQRLDRHDSYIWFNLVLLVFGWIVIFVEVPYSNLGSAALGTQQTLGISLLLGSALTLTGSVLGLRAGKLCVARSVCKNPLAVMLGDDIRVPYVLAWGGLFSTIISMAFYSYTVIKSAGAERMVTTLGGLAAIAITGMCLTLIPKFIIRIRRYVTARDVLITEALESEHL